MKRRNFIKIGTIGGMTLQFPGLISMNISLKGAVLPKRILGKTGEKISIVGFGGIALRNNGQEFANRIIAEASDRGINYFDIAPDYGDSQALLGPALEPYRQNSFLACKTGMRDRKGAEEELNESLRQLKTDHVDLYQFHALSEMEDLDKVFGPSGAIETFVKARQEGKVRFIGFSAHNEKVALRAMELFEFDAILYPINCVCWHNGNFGPKVFETARNKNMGVLAIKAVARTHVSEEDAPYPNMWYRPFEKDEDIATALRFTLSKDLTATVHAGDVKFLKKTLDIVSMVGKFDPPADSEITKMVHGISPIFEHPES